MKKGDKNSFEEVILLTYITLLQCNTQNDIIVVIRDSYQSKAMENNNSGY
jgi:hypothetical protein